MQERTEGIADTSSLYRRLRLKRQSGEMVGKHHPTLQVVSLMPNKLILDSFIPEVGGFQDYQLGTEMTLQVDP